LIAYTTIIYLISYNSLYIYIYHKSLVAAAHMIT